MIVNPTNEGWEIFSHSSHGLLAGKIANELQDKYKNKNWVATLAAIIEHDDRQLEFDEKNYLTNTGAPKDFLLEKRNVEEIIKRSKRLLQQAEGKSTWIAMLIVHHLIFIYKEMASEKKTISNFLEKLEKKEQQYIKNQNLSWEEVDSIYQVMVFSDRCSLILCQNAVPTKSRLLEVNTSINDQTFWISEKSTKELKIEPWIFRSKHFTINAEYKMIEKNSFSSNKEFKKLLEASKVKFKTWNFSK
ncbi:DUF3891 family protein [Salegentibacter sp. Hel_I_6]|uniref:DUF3891 family protein n=1 Tax=Salegentibacter sp. Hel_I_6 TaxID=1250278 RepID=UPI00056B4BD2|nr:DUF3891 family protein [Salegentibacter sp. Hel_I_6]